MKKIFGIVGGLLLVLIGIYAVFPNGITKLAFSGTTFFAGEFWRILTYPFVHVTGIHLLENLIALFVLSLLAYEFKLKTRDFVILFIGSGIIIAFFGGILYPYLIIAGASLGVYSIFGALTVKEQNFIPKYILPTFFGIIIFLNIVYSIYIEKEIAQPAYHAAGFLVGSGIFKLKEFKEKRRKVRILQ